MSYIDIEKIYNKSPVMVQNLFCSLKGYIICRRRYNKNFYKQLELFENRKINPYISLQYFFENIKDVPYYKQLFNDYNFNIYAENLYDEIKKLPILSKDTVKEKIRLLSNPYYKGKVSKMKTSGTTGSGLVFPYSQEMENKQWAVWWRYRRWHGIDMNIWCGWFGGRSIISTHNRTPPFWRINIPGKQVMFSAYHLNSETVGLYYSEILKRKLQWLHGYPSQISLLANAILEKGLSPIPSIKYITFGAENFLENQKRIIQKAFPYSHLWQHYGLAEGVANISKDVNEDWVVDDDFCYVEFIPISQADPKSCRIIGTGFSNMAFPLVRYDTGDIAEIDYLPDGKIKVLSIDGRKEDFITLPNGVKLGRLDHLFKELTAIKEAQIHQKDLYHIDFNIVKGYNFNVQTEYALLKEIRKRIDESVSVNINYIDKIERTKSGKLRFVISEVKN